MLQQTQVETVIPYYHRFLKKFPTVRALADANVEEVLKLWEGLGYYRRARSLHSAAKKITDEFHGRFPRSFDEVLSLPGIGRYTAGAILSIACDQKLPILEGNTIRLFARLDGVQSNVKQTSTIKKLWNFSESIIPDNNCGDFNQALMELGNQICKPASPECPQCPIKSYCAAFEMEKVDSIPHASSPPKVETIYEAMFIIERNGKLLVRKCKHGERWQGLYDFPRLLNQTSKPDPLQLAKYLKSNTGLTAAPRRSNQKQTHHVTKYKINLDTFLIRNPDGQLKKKSGFNWKSIDDLLDLPLNTTARKSFDSYIQKRKVKELAKL